MKKVHLMIFSLLMLVPCILQANKIRHDTAALPSHYTAFEIGIKKGTSDLWDGKFVNDGYYFNLHVFSAIRLYDNLSIGPGVGLEAYAYGSYMPVYADLRYHMGNGKLLPVVSVDLGYSFGWPKQDINGSEWAGLMFTPALSLALKEDGRSKYFVKFAYKLQKMRTPEINFGSERVDAEYFEFKIGFVF